MVHLCGELELVARQGEFVGGHHLKDDVVESLVVAILAVNSFPLDKAWELLPRLREAKITSPNVVAEFEVGALTVALAASGYDRGMLTGLFAERLKDLMSAIISGALDELPAALLARDESRASELLCGVRGVGKKVVGNALLLLLSDKA